MAAHGPSGLASGTWGIGTDGSGKVILLGGLSVLFTAAAAVQAHTYFIRWATRPNPDTTVGSNALISEIFIWDSDDQQVDELRHFTHAVPTTNAAWYLHIGGRWNGASADRVPTNGLTAARISTAYHPTEEGCQDWIANRDPHVTQYVTPEEPIGAGAPTGEIAEWAGQANVGFAAAQAFAMRGRMLSPLVRDVIPLAYPVLLFANATGPRLVGAPDDDRYRMDVTRLAWIEIPDVQFAWARVQILVAAGEENVPVGLRVYAMNRPHIGVGGEIGGAPTPALQVSMASAMTGNDGDGGWVELGPVRLPKFEQDVAGWKNTCVLALAWAIDPDDEADYDAYAYIYISAWEVIPMLGVPIPTD
jgi:hypothetical protein